MDRAACRGHKNPDWWFPGHGSGSKAIRVCRQCPVTGSCAKYALDSRRVDGVVAGVALGGERRFRDDRDRLRQLAAAGDCVDSSSQTDASKSAARLSVRELPLLLPVPRAAALLGVSRAGAYRMAARNELPIRRFGGRIYVVSAALRDLLESS
nr:WhiB family transcriptional regulator [Aldersonia kunmingensis]